MLGDASDFTPLDLLGSLGLNAAATHFACQDGTLRTGIKIGANKQVEAYTDARFLGGIAAAIAGQFGPPMARRVGHDVATGLLGSFVATETCRMAAKAKKQHIEMVPDQITEAPPADSAPAAGVKGKGAKNYARGSMNSSYGW
jgi:hypothetical protein